MMMEGEYLDRLASRSFDDDDKNATHAKDTTTSSTRAASIVWLRPVDILKVIDFGWRQWVLLMYATLASEHFVVQMIVPSLTLQSLWMEWPWLSRHPVIFNSVFAFQEVGRFVGAFFFAPLSDVFGRRNMIFIATIFPAMLAFLCLLSPNFATYVMFRCFIILLCMPASTSSMFYLFELVHSTRRALICQLFLVLSDGYVAYASICRWLIDRHTGDKNLWRWLQIAVTIPAVLCLPLALLVWVESPQFLLNVKNDKKAAWKVYDCLSANRPGTINTRLNLTDNREEVRFINIDGVPSDEDDVIERQLELTSSHSTWALIPPTASTAPTNIQVIEESESEEIHTVSKPTARSVLSFEANLKSWKKIFSKDLRSLTLILILIWFLTAFSYWGFTSYISLFYDYLGVPINATTISLYIVQMFGHGLEYFMMHCHWGGRIFAMKITSCAGAALAVLLGVLVRVVPANQIRSHSGYVAVLAVLMSATGSILWGPVFSYTNERYPVHARGGAMSLFYCTVSVASIATTYLGSLNMNATTFWLMPIVWGAVRLGVFICACSLSIDVRNEDFGECVM